MEKSGSSIFLKNFLLSALAIILAIVLVLTGYAIGKVDTEKKEDKTSTSTEVKIDKNKTYEEISEKEIKSLRNETVFLLYQQGKNIDDVKLFLSNDYYNDWIIYKVLANKFFNENKTSITKEEVIEGINKMFGYEIDVKFHDILDDIASNTTGFRWHEDTQTYTCDEASFGHGGYFGYNIYDLYKYIEFDKNVTREDNNIYIVTAKVVWMNQKWATEDPDVSNKYYATYDDVKNNKNEIVSLTENSETWFEEVPYDETDNDNYFEKVDNYIYQQGEDKMHTYEYKIVKENGIIRILSYKKID